MISADWTESLEPVGFHVRHYFDRSCGAGYDARDRSADWDSLGEQDPTLRRREELPDLEPSRRFASDALIPRSPDFDGLEALCVFREQGPWQRFELLLADIHGPVAESPGLPGNRRDLREPEATLRVHPDEINRLPDIV